MHDAHEVVPSGFRFQPGLERMDWGVDAAEQLPLTMTRLGYERAFVFASRSLHRLTPAVTRIAEHLGGRLVGVSDEVGEHAPISNVLAGLDKVRAAGADVVVCVGGGSVSDFGKFVQLGLTVGAHTRAELLDWTARRVEGELVFAPPESYGPMAVRQIAVPTTFATAEVTASGTPVDDVTGAKVLFAVRDGSPRSVIYDPDLLQYTPSALLAATGVRGFDHAISNVLSVRPNAFGSELSLRAATLFHHFLPRAAADGADRHAVSQCQLATWMTGMSNLGSIRGFSLYAVHVLAPWAGTAHGDAACVMLLAQARWFCGQPDPVLDELSETLGRPGDRFDVVVADFLESMALPTSLADLGVAPSRIGKLAELMMQNPSLTRNNRRPITSLDDITAVLQLVAA